MKTLQIKHGAMSQPVKTYRSCGRSLAGKHKARVTITAVTLFCLALVIFDLCYYSSEMAK